MIYESVPFSSVVLPRIRGLFSGKVCLISSYECSNSSSTAKPCSLAQQRKRVTCVTVCGQCECPVFHPVNRLINTYSVIRCMGCLKTGRQTGYGPVCFFFL